VVRSAAVVQPDWETTPHRGLGTPSLVSVRVKIKYGIYIAAVKRELPDRYSIAVHLKQLPSLRSGRGPVAEAVTGPGMLGLLAR
jgi:hypothetical protein